MRDADHNQPPQNLVAEQSVLGCMLLDNRCVDAVRTVLNKSGQFYGSAHQTISEAIFAVIESGKAADILTVAEELDRRQQLAEIGGAQYLMELLESTPHAAHHQHYAEIVRDRWLDRGVIGIGTDLIREQHDGSKERSAIIADAEQRLHSLMESGVVAGPRAISDVVLDWVTERASGRVSQQYIPTGYLRWDQLTGGVPAGRVTTLAARTSHGKTSLLQGVGLRMAEVGVPVAIFSYEMSASELMGRFVSVLSRLPLEIVQRLQLTGADAHAVTVAADRLAALPLLIDDSAPDEASLYAALRVAVRRRGIRVAIIDYMQLIEPTDRRVPREQQVANLSRSLCKLAMTTGLTIITAAQLNREVEKREGKRPRLSDLRESGAIENDSAMVALLSRPNKDADGIDTFDSFGEVQIAKNRGGRTGAFNLTWWPSSAEFRDDEGMEFP